MACRSTLGEKKMAALWMESTTSIHLRTHVVTWTFFVCFQARSVFGRFAHPAPGDARRKRNTRTRSTFNRLDHVKSCVLSTDGHSIPTCYHDTEAQTTHKHAFDRTHCHHLGFKYVRSYVCVWCEKCVDMHWHCYHNCSNNLFTFQHLCVQFWCEYNS